MRLITTVEEIKQFVAVNTSIEFENIQPFIDQAQFNFIIPELSPEQFNELVQAYDDESMSPEQENLLPYVQRALTYFAFYLYIPQNMVQISDSGIRIVTDANLKTAFEWQIDKLEESFLNMAYASIETMLAFLEENKDDYPQFTESQQYTENLAYFLHNAVEFSKHYDINNSRRLYRRLRFIMRNIEQSFVRPILGIPYYKDIQEKLVANEITEAEEKVLELARPAVAFLTMANAMLRLPIVVTPDGVITLSTSSTETVVVKEPAGDNKLLALMEADTEVGRSNLALLRAFLNANADDYLMFKASGNYTAPGTENKNPHNNGAGNPVFVT